MILGTLNCNPSVVHPVHSRYTDYATAAPYLNLGHLKQMTKLLGQHYFTNNEIM
jgi:hypothetical protein